MQLLACKELAAGTPLTLNYGERPLRAMVRGYGFVPSPSEWPIAVVEEVGDLREALIVSGAPGQSGFMLQQVV